MAVSGRIEKQSGPKLVNASKKTSKGTSERGGFLKVDGSK